MKTKKLNYARLTGIMLLAMAVLAGYSFGYAMSSLYVENNAPQTLQNLLANSSLYQQMTLGFVLILLLDVLVSFTLFYWLKAKMTLMVKWMSAIRLVYSAVLAYGIIKLLSMYSFETDTNEELVYQVFSGFHSIFSAGLVIFGIHLFLLGFILIKRTEVPKIFGILALFAGVCYSLMHGLYLISPDLKTSLATVEQILALPMAAGELALAIWMVIKGRSLN